MALMDDRDLVKRLKDGDLTAFAELVRRYEDRIYNLCRYLVRDPGDAQDAAQEVFLKAFRRFKDFRPDASLYTWLYRIAVNTCIDYRRRSRREASREDVLSDDLPSAEPFPDQIYESKEIAEAIQAALPKLREKLRAPIVLREIEGLTYEEIADVLHISVGTVKSRISRARDGLRNLLKKRL
jgi:RNA polymerase sigma-70 factor (ECF subfamily)